MIKFVPSTLHYSPGINPSIHGNRITVDARCAAVINIPIGEKAYLRPAEKHFAPSEKCPSVRPVKYGRGGFNRFGTLAVHGSAAIKSAERGERTRARFSAFVEISVARLYRGFEGKSFLLSMQFRDDRGKSVVDLVRSNRDQIRFRERQVILPRQKRPRSRRSLFTEGTIPPAALLGLSSTLLFTERAFTC